MDWSKPQVLDVNMSAEIGAYQDDAGEADVPDVERKDDAPAPMRLQSD